MDNGELSRQCMPPNSSLEDANLNYFTSLCTVFVATIQEAKDRISQLEFIFCSQLFPTFQSELTKSSNIAKRLEQLNKDATEEWKRDRKSLLTELDELKTEKKQLQENIQSMKISFEQQKKELSSAFEVHRSHNLEKEQLISKIEDETLKLREELQQRLKEIDEGKASREKLLQQVSKMEEELKLESMKQCLQASELERERNSKQDAIYQFKNLKKMYRGLRAQYDVILSLNGMSTDKTSSGKKKLQNESRISPDNLKQRSLYDYQAPDTGSGEARIISEQKETEINVNGNLKGADHLRDNSSFQAKLENVQVEEPIARSYSSKYGLDGSMANPDMGNVQSKEMAAKTLDGNSKCMPLEDEETEEQTNELRKGVENHGFRVIKPEKESSASFPIPQWTQLQKRPLEAKAVPPNSLRRKNSSWRETRLRQEPGANFDPHDDFLDTPMETVLQSLKQKPEVCSNEPDRKPIKVEEKVSAPNRVEICEVPRPNNVILDLDMSDDDETQAVDPNCIQKTLSARAAELASNSGALKPENSTMKSVSNNVGKPKEQNQRHANKCGTGYKYIEPVRKKADREALKGVECNQCKKFYDAVRMEGAEVAGDISCEHHNDVSRHRYRYVPPATPEGFWNIGFDTDREPSS